MTVWFDLPIEIRLSIYEHFYGSAKVLLHPLSACQYAAYYSWLVDSDRDDERPSLFDASTATTSTSTSNKQLTALRCTSRRLWAEAEPYYYACTNFEIECFSGHIISEPRFEIDKRVQHLTITWDTDFDEILLFLRRHFHHADTKMYDLFLENGPFPYDIFEAVEGLLPIARGQIARITFREDNTAVEQRDLEEEFRVHRCPKSKSTFIVSQGSDISIDACCERLARYYKTTFVSENIFKEDSMFSDCTNISDGLVDDSRFG